MRGIEFIKKIFTPLDVKCIECTIVNFDTDVLNHIYDSEEDFKLELVEVLKEFGYKFSKRTSLKKICEAIMDRSLMEEMEEQNAKEDGPLSELEEWQLQNNSNNDSDVDIPISDMEQYDGYDIGDANGE